MGDRLNFPAYEQPLECVATDLDFAAAYFSSRIDGVKVIPTNNPSGPMKRLTVWPHCSFLFLTSIW